MKIWQKARKEYMAIANTENSKKPRARGPFPYLGGKTNLADTIISCFPEHATYIEPFAGGAQVLFHKPPSRSEIINDLDDELTTFFRVVQNHQQELARYASDWRCSRTWFDILRETNPKSLTDIQRATRFLYLQKVAYGSKILSQQFSCRPYGSPSFNPDTLPQIIASASNRLKHVQIECLPYERILKRFDKPSSLFYLDPPYLGKPFYHHNFKREDFETLRANLKSLRAKFLLSINDTGEIRDLFSDFYIRQVDVRYSIVVDEGSQGKELLISNFPPKRARN